MQLKTMLFALATTMFTALATMAMEPAQEERKLDDRSKSQSPSITENTQNLRDKFIEEVNTFKETFNNEGKDGVERLRDFVSKPYILDYLKRSDISFDERGPIGCSEQELWLYKMLGEYCSSRQDIASGKFYKNGITYGSGTVYGSHNPFLSEECRNIGTYVNVLGVGLRDVYSIRDQVTEFDLKNIIYPKSFEPSNVKKIISSSSRVCGDGSTKDGHATTFVHILNETLSRVMMTIFINSSDDPIYFKYTKHFFNNTKTEISLRDTNKKILEEGKISQESLDQQFPWLTITTDGSLEPKNKEEDWYGMFGVRRKLPLMNASHDLQINDTNEPDPTKQKDQNCVIYSMNFLRAINEMLNNQEIKNKIFMLASEIEKAFLKNGESDPTYIESVNAMRKIFTEDLKKYLPQYYLSLGERRKLEDIEEYHKRLRWELSGKRIEYFVKNGK